MNQNQQFVTVNRATGETTDSRIVYLGPMLPGAGKARLAAIEFMRPAPGFWGVVFPKVEPSRTPARNYSR